jgi:hypothetical protein
LMTAALGWGVVCQVEGLCMSFMLSEWHRDVKTLGAAWRLRSTLSIRGAANEKQIPPLRFGMTKV